jgi:D-arabinose 1-dehydrogenase-like Zn-dependent alcohol dehydrogenase
VAGSSLGNFKDVKEMLEFVALYNVAAKTEHYSFEDIGKAFHKLENSHERYKIVVDVNEWARKNGFDR